MLKLISRNKQDQGGNSLLVFNRTNFKWDRVQKKEKRIVGWREWLSLPGLGIEKIKAKIDTGARSSSLHACDMQVFTRPDGDYVRFAVYPLQKDIKIIVACEERIMEYRRVRSSNGKTELRPVIITDVKLMNKTWPIEITLTDRSVMGFRMLLGRQSIRKRFLVDAGTSFLAQKKINKSGKNR